MKRLILIVLSLLLSLICLAQAQEAKVTMKNGTILTGQVTELNPTSHVKLIVGGFETTINMSDIESIENVYDSKSIESGNGRSQASVATETHDYDDLPEVYNMKVGPYIIEMKLIKGATFSMGYDGAGSMRMNSEPVHDVTLSSYYINSKPLNKDIVGYLKKGKEEHGKTNSVYRPFSRNDAKDIADKVAKLSNLPVDLITEAQWEYAATRQDGIFTPNKSEWNYCYDYYGDYTSSKVVEVDPKGPKYGKSYVIRRYEKEPYIVYSRSESSLSGGASLIQAIRITFPAKSIK